MYGRYDEGGPIELVQDTFARWDMRYAIWWWTSFLDVYVRCTCMRLCVANVGSIISFSAISKRYFQHYQCYERVRACWWCCCCWNRVYFAAAWVPAWHDILLHHQQPICAHFEIREYAIPIDDDDYYYDVHYVCVLYLSVDGKMKERVTYGLNLLLKFSNNLSFNFICMKNAREARSCRVLLAKLTIIILVSWAIHMYII